MNRAEIKGRWLSQLSPGQVSGLFNSLPDTLYFAKDSQLRIMSGNRAFVERCGFTSEEEMVGHRDREVFPVEMAEKYLADDRQVIESGEPLTGIVELFPNRMGEPEWFTTDKLPLFNKAGEVAGLCGIVRSFEGARVQLQPYLDLLPVTKYLKEHYGEKVSLSDLAQEVGMSLRKLQRRFQETFKTTPQKYIARLRVLEGCELLTNTQLSVTEISLRVGFYDHAAFSKKFSELIRMSPREYRKLH